MASDLIFPFQGGLDSPVGHEAVFTITAGNARAAINGTSVGIEIDSDSSIGVLGVSNPFPPGGGTGGIPLIAKSIGVQGTSNPRFIPGPDGAFPRTAPDQIIGVFGQCDFGEAVVGHGPTGAIGVLGCKDRQFSQSAGVYGESSNQGVMGLTTAPSGTGVFGGGTTSAKGSAIGVRGETTTGVGVQGQSFGAGLAGKFIGNVEVTGDVRLVNADCAEDFDLSGAETIEPGTVMAFDQDGMLSQSEKAYDKKVAGVISGAGGYRPGIVLDKQESQTNRMPIALLGKVFCKVDADYSPIEVGDLLTTSPTAGHAMKADDPLKSFGSVIGKALRPLGEGQGLIPILVTLQ
jgi:hypothetical protein